MYPQKLVPLDLQDDEKLRNIQMNTDFREKSSEKKPFYYSNGWLVLWSLLLWPIGLLMMWGYLTNMKEHELPRTNSIDKEVNKDL
ncbi:MAG: hypothetical protein JJE18_10285 [Eubacteriaceae bacterium]|nr:hypothetical protein [Eubacteriaceae bacterium]